MANSIFRTFFLSLIFISSSFSDTNLGTIQHAIDGFVQLKECMQSSSDCSQLDISYSQNLKDIFSLSTMNQCVATKLMSKNGKKPPKCPDPTGKLVGLDHTYPTGGIFALYNGRNEQFIADMVSNYMKNEPEAKVNIIIPYAFINKISTSTRLKSLLNNPTINFIPVRTMPKVDIWMQDSFQFTTINQKPALYQLEHFQEQDDKYADRLACILARKCNLPYFIPEKMLDPKNANSNSLNSGGNLEVLPGGTFYRGIIKTNKNNPNLPQKETLPFETKYQATQKQALIKQGNSVLDLDVGFLHVGHVDEIVNIVKTNKPAPCDYALLIASPKKAFSILESAANKIDINTKNYQEDRCYNLTLFELRNSVSEIKTNKEMNNFVHSTYKNDCIDGAPVETFVKSEEYEIIKRQNLSSNSSIDTTASLTENKNLIVEELKKTTGCSNPKVIELPIFFKSGISYLPNSVNAVVQTPAGKASNIIMPRTYFKPFDKYIKKKLEVLGVKTSFVHDLDYHLFNGEVHCGTNTVPVCTPHEE